MRKKVSVIVPVYNMEQMLYQTLGNLLNQSLQELEILLVDDCSTDQSAGVLEQCRMQFPQRDIRVLHTEYNSGAGGARNLGIARAKGEYIGFMDADDLIALDMYEKLYAKAVETDADLVDSGYYMEEKDTAIIHTSDALTGTLNGEKRRELIVSGGYIVTKIFRREWILREGMRFREHAILEDSDFLTHAFATADRIANVKEILYQYRYFPNSASNTKDFEKYYSNILAAMKANYEAVRELPTYGEIRSAVDYMVIQMYNYGVVMCLHHLKENGRERTIADLEQLREVRGRIASEGYENPYVQNKIEAADIELMVRNDKDPNLVWNWIRQK